MKKILLTAITFLLAWCSLSLPQDIQQTTTQTINTIKLKSGELRDTVITMVGNAEVTALPAIENFKDQVVTTIKSHIQWSSSENNTVQCLQEKGIVYYTSNTCSFASQQRVFLEQEYSSFDRIYCDPELDIVTCKQAGVQGTPAWWIKDWKLIHWVQTIDSLAKEFNCN